MDEHYELVPRPIVSILSDLRRCAETDPNFDARRRELGIEFTEAFLTSRAKASAFRGLRGLRQLVPSLAQSCVEEHKIVIITAWALVANVPTVVKIHKQK